MNNPDNKDISIEELLKRNIEPENIEDEEKDNSSHDKSASHKVRKVIDVIDKL